MFSLCFYVDVESHVGSFHRVDVRRAASVSNVLLVSHLEMMSKRDYIAHVTFIFRS
jgi:hypothetical protein